MKGFKFAIDRGGTFTDIVLVSDDGKVTVSKLLSEDPLHYADAPSEGIRRALADAGRKEIGGCIDASAIDWIRMGTTVATNALLERKGDRVALLITKGFADLLRIGNQSRPDIFDLSIKKRELLFECVIEIDERVRVIPDLESGRSRDETVVVRAPNVKSVEQELRDVVSKGIRSAAIVFLHSYAFPDHELIIEKLCRSVGFTHVSVSHQLMPMARAVPRGLTTCADAYLSPILRRYVDSFCAAFEGELFRDSRKLLFMQSDGGLCTTRDFSGFRSLLSGPAGGVVGYSSTAFDPVSRKPVLGLDVGGTSSDVSRFDGSLRHVLETTVAGVPINAPQLEIKTVAAGGGSRLFFQSGMFVVGPESSGAHPGPVCYRNNGYLSITDANVVLGRVLPEFFPSIFGPEHNQPLDVDAAVRAFDEMASSINAYMRIQDPQWEDMTRDDVAIGFINVANETMTRPIRSMTESCGLSTADHRLACFGGAGPQHALSVAQNLGISEVVISPYAAILSALGLALANVVREDQEACSLVFCKQNRELIMERLSVLSQTVCQALKEYGFVEDQFETEFYLNVRYEGTDTAHMTRFVGFDQFLSDFEASYLKEYGFSAHNRRLMVDDLRVRGIGKSTDAVNPETFAPVFSSSDEDHCVRSVVFGGLGRIEVPVYLYRCLGVGVQVDGPCLIVLDTTTLVVEPAWVCTISKRGDMMCEQRSAVVRRNVSTSLSSVYLSIFSHRFMSIAEQMGRTLQRISSSTNITERLDFSCAIFGPDGSLVANAPHLPVHLGSMSEAVRFQINYFKMERLAGRQGWNDGDVIVSNHPMAGGTHLPDITVISAVFSGESEPVFYVASRGHHADIGGKTPGSMPPDSRSLGEEGLQIRTLKLVANNDFREDVIEKLLTDAGARRLSDNIGDLKAQVAANQRGIGLLSDLITTYSLEVVHAYMIHIRDASERAVREMIESLSSFPPAGEFSNLEAVDWMDDGTPITLTVKLGQFRDGTCAQFDFEGTGPQSSGNTNAPVAITRSAILYCLRSLVWKDIPLNDGCLVPISIKIPDASLLSPQEGAAVVGGNVLTSQRLCDVILYLFGVANSQGCMNNLSFGCESFGYYETIAGGAGAGDRWNGSDGVHTHMTNTRITDPEILEKRYPVCVVQFGLRRGSGGIGEHRGGDGVIRELEFLVPLRVSILSERRTYPPRGICGGSNGHKGMNIWRKRNGCSEDSHHILTDVSSFANRHMVSEGRNPGDLPEHAASIAAEVLPPSYWSQSYGPSDIYFTNTHLEGKDSVSMQKGDRIVILTPGGGAHGEKQ